MSCTSVKMCSDLCFFWWIQQCWKTRLQKGWKCKVVSWWTIKSICQKERSSCQYWRISGCWSLDSQPWHVDLEFLFILQGHMMTEDVRGDQTIRESVSIYHLTVFACLWKKRRFLSQTTAGQWPCAKSLAHHKRGRGLIHSSCPWWYAEHGWMHFSDHCFLKNIFIFSHSDWWRNDPVINSSWVTFHGPQGNRSHIHVWLTQKLNRVHWGKKEGAQRYSPSSLLISGPEAKKKPEALISLWPWS